MRSHAKASTAGSTQNKGRAVSAQGIQFSLSLLTALFLLALGAGSAVAAAPTIPLTTVTAVSTSTAVLEADIDPEGEATTYRFEYGPADCGSNPCTSIPVPNENVGSGSAPVRVLEEVKGLQPDTTYHFRAVATNGSGTTPGPDRTFRTYATPAASDCPNQVLRVGPSATLPDCRAYEMVSPVDKNGGDIIASIFAFGEPRQSYNQAAIGGGKITYSTSTAFGDQASARGSNQYIAVRGPNGWSTRGINAPLGQTIAEPAIDFFGDVLTQFKLFTPDLSNAWVTDFNKIPLTPDASEGFPNLYRRDNVSETYEALTRVAPTTANTELERYVHEVQGHSSDYGHLVFDVRGALTPDAAPTKEWQLYDYTGGQLHLVSVLPDGTAFTGRSSAGTDDPGEGSQYEGMVKHAVSDDGSRIFWTANVEGDSRGTLYVRENPGQPQSALNGSNECTEPAKACTRLIAGGTENHFWAATSNGAEVLYTTGSLDPLQSASLSKFDVDAETATPVAGEVGGVVGASEDLSYVYFTSKEVLDAGATAGEWNVYLDHEGAKTFIATVSQLDRDTPESGSNRPDGIDAARSVAHAARVTPDGRHLAFMSNRSLTGYDNTDAVNGKPASEVYLYEADSDELLCVSCNPSGARPVGEELNEPYRLPWVARRNTPGVWAASWLQTWVFNMYQSRALSDDGSRLYFNSFDALVPRDTNGAQDVYQWEAQGSGTCQRAGGCVDLVSTGKDAGRSEFVDATADGSEVFFETPDSIDPRDPGLIDIYVARVNGGLPLPAEPAGCVGDTCQNIPAPPNDPTPASASFRGAGDPPAPKGRKRKCRARGRRANKARRSAAQSRPLAKRAKRCRPTSRRAGR